MKNVDVIKEERNKIKESMKKIDEKIEAIKNGEDNCSEILNKLYSLRVHYFDQIRGINFCLNEDSELDNFSWNPHYSEVQGYLFKKENN